VEIRSILQGRGNTAVVSIGIVAQSDYGHTWRQAEAVAEGAQATGAGVDLVRIDQDGILDDAAWDALARADGVVFGCPTHMGGPSWQFKRFADATNHRTWVPALWRDKFAGGFTNSAAMSGDKFSTLTYFWTLAMQHGMVWVGSGMKPAIGYDKLAPRESLNYIGSYTGVMAASPLNDPAEMSQADLATAKAYGERFGTFVATGRSSPTPYRDFTIGLEPAPVD
jgi:NAD(P)H dehydrogenase (quinone)